MADNSLAKQARGIEWNTFNYCRASLRGGWTIVWKWCKTLTISHWALALPLWTMGSVWGVSVSCRSFTINENILNYDSTHCMSSSSNNLFETRNVAWLFLSGVFMWWCHKISSPSDLICSPIGKLVSWDFDVCHKDIKQCCDITKMDFAHCCDWWPYDKTQ